MNPTAVYNANNQWGSTSMTYDLNGNTLNDGTNSYVWDARNRLVSADGNGASFAYDPLGRRVSKTISSTTTGFLYDGVNAIEELNGAETASQTQYSYSPYGAQSATGAFTANSYAYTGREFDGLGIDYYRARYYNPATGRFLSEDPAGFAGGSPNFYAYVEDSPTNEIDPSGDFPIAGTNWCGPDWTGGKKEEYDPTHDNQYLPPNGAVDTVCRTHDICYYQARKAYPCDKEKRRQAMRDRKSTRLNSSHL